MHGYVRGKSSVPSSAVRPAGRRPFLRQRYLRLQSIISAAAAQEL